MPVAHHTLRVGAETTGTTLADLGITSCVVTLASLRGDEMIFEIPVDSTDATAPAIAAGAIVRLYDQTHVCRFHGVCMEPEPYLTQTAEGWRYRVRGGDYLLDCVPYEQNWQFPEEVPEALISPATEMTQELVSLVTLFRDWEGGEKVSLQEQLGLALAQGVAGMAAEGIAIDYALTYVPTIEPPEDEVRDQSVLDVVESCLLWAPYVSARWDYALGTPTLRFSAAPAIDSGGTAIPGGQVDGAGFETRTMPVTAMVACAPQPVSDRLVKTVELSYLIVDDVDGPPRIIYRRLERDTSTIANGSLMKRKITVPLRGLLWNGEEHAEPEPRPANGLARALHQAFARTWWKCDFTIAAQEVNWDYKVGEGWLVTGTGANLAASNSIAQTITRDLMTGHTRIVTGPPGHLGYGELVSLLLANRIRRVPTRAGEQQYGFGKDEKDGNDDANKFNFHSPENGDESIYRIIAERVAP